MTLFGSLLQIPCAERRVWFPIASTATEHAGATATEHRRTASRDSPHFYIDVAAGFVYPGSATEQTMRQ